MVGCGVLLISIGLPTTTCIGCRKGRGDLQENKVREYKTKCLCQIKYECMKVLLELLAKVMDKKTTIQSLNFLPFGCLKVKTNAITQINNDTQSTKGNKQ